MSEEDINFLISIQDLEQPEFDNVYLERENENLRYPNLIKSYQKENKELKIKLLEEQLKNEKLDRRII